MIRYLKIILVAFVGLQGLIYFGANLSNWETAVAVVGQVLAQGDRPYYPNNLAPALSSPALAMMTAVIIVAGELLVGVLSLYGAFKMFGAAGKPADRFNASKTFALLGCGMALIQWFGLFTVIGGAAFQMWQHDLGRNSLTDAHFYLVPSGIVMLFVALKDE